MILLSPPSLKTHRPEEHQEASTRIKRNLKNTGFWICEHQIITTVLKRFWSEPETSQGEKKNYMLKFSFATGYVLRTELWNQHLGFTGQLPECPPASQSTHASIFWNWLYSYQRQTLPSTVTPQRAERYDLHLALWLPESTCDRGQQGLTGQGWAMQHLLQC